MRGVLGFCFPKLFKLFRSCREKLGLRLVSFTWRVALQRARYQQWYIFVYYVTLLYSAACDYYIPRGNNHGMDWSQTVRVRREYGSRGRKIRNPKSSLRKNDCARFSSRRVSEIGCGYLRLSWQIKKVQRHSANIYYTRIYLLVNKRSTLFPRTKSITCTSLYVIT